MKVKNVKITKLFGEYNYNIDLDEDVAIIYGQNGQGKTTILKMIRDVISLDFFGILISPKYKCVEIKLDNGKIYSCSKMPVKEKEYLDLYDEKYDEDSYDYIPYVTMKIEENGNVLFDDDIYVVLNRKGTRVIERDDEFENLTFGELIDKKELDESCFGFYLGKTLPDDLKNISNYGYKKDPLLSRQRRAEELLNKLEAKNQDIIKENKINVLFIEANRILKSEQKEDDEKVRFRREGHIVVYEPIERRRNYFNKLLNDAYDDKAKNSDKLFKNYASDLLNKVFNEQNDATQMLKDIKNYSSQINDLEEKMDKFGLLDNKSNIQKYINNLNDKKDESTIVALWLNLKNTLYIYKTFYDKVKAEDIERLLTFFNNRMYKKKLMIKDQKLCVTKNDESTEDIPVTKLSSGEKNLFVLFFDILFNNYENTIVLVDEPEISLHVNWQKSIIDELVPICKNKNSQAIVATHSPIICDGHVDLMRELLEK